MKLDKSRNTRQSRSTELTALLRDVKGESKKRFDRSLTLLVGLAIATTLAAQTTMPARAGQNGQERRAENAAQGNKNQAQQQQQQRNRNRAAKDTRQGLQKISKQLGRSKKLFERKSQKIQSTSGARETTASCAR